MAYDTAMDYGDAQDGPRGNASCSDCGEDFFKGQGDVGSLCDACCDQRDAHTSALEIRLASDSGSPASVVTQAPWFNAAAAPRQWAIDRLPTLSAVAASRAGKPIPKKATRGKAVA